MTIGRCALLTVGLLSLVGASALAYYPMGRYNTAVSPNVLIPARYDVTALPNSTITFYLTTQRPQTLAPGDSVEAIISELAAAAAVWNSVSSSALRVGFGGYTKVSGARPLVNPIGVIGFSDSIPPGAAAVGGTVFRIPSGTPAFLPVVASFVDMPLDMSRTNSSSNSFLGIVVHEMGHSLGAAHSHVAAVMFQSGGTSRARVLTEDDVALIAELYPAASVASSTGSISGRVVTASGQGASVVGVGAFSDTAVVGGMTGPDGNFTIRGLPPGTYRLMVQPLMLGGAPSPDADNPGDPADLIRVRTLTNEVVRINTDIDSAFFAGGGATTRDRNAAATFPVNAGQTTAGAQITIGSRGPLRLEANDTRTIAAPNVPSFRSPGFVWVTRGGQAAGFSTGRALTTPGLQISFTNPGVSTAGSPTTFFSSDPDEVFNTAIGYPVQATPTAVLGSSSVLYLNAGDAYFSPGHLRVVASGPPQISGISPASGPPQTAITITGSSFTDSSRVYFDGMPATVTARTATTSLVVVAPLGASGRAAAVFVANEDGQGSEFLAAPPIFTYSSAPQPSLSISPSTAGLGQSLTVRVTGTNTNFRAGETVLGFGSGDVVVNSVTVESPTLLTASVRVSAVVSSGTFPVTAITGEQVAFLDDGFTVATPPPTSHLLTSGQPAPYSLPAVTGNTLFTGDFSYQIVVPSGATRLDVQLRTTTPG
ncbi:MAG: IPT/TIG domain-containing protein, partial [Terriglobia bacterium]